VNRGSNEKPEGSGGVGPPGFEPRTNRLCIPLQLSLPLSGSWAGPSLYPAARVPAVWSLHLPRLDSGLGSGLPYRRSDVGFPEFDRCLQKITPLEARYNRSCRYVWVVTMTKPHPCLVCGNPLVGKQTKFCSIDCKNKHHQSYEAQKRRGIDRKLTLIEAAGGKCSVCGYQKNLAALSFHHTESATKDFKLDMRSLSNRTYASVQSEISKCILVCLNCHAELHNPHLDLDLLC